jgi:hypothetical protein
MAGLGFGLGISKDANNQLVPGGDTSAMQFQIFIPVEAGVQHFFARWLAMGISAAFNCIDVRKQGSPYKIDFAINNTQYMGSLFVYSD